MPSNKFQPLPRHIREPIVYLLGGVIRELREKRGLTPAALAKRVLPQTTRYLVAYRSGHYLASVAFSPRHSLLPRYISIAHER